MTDIQIEYRTEDGHVFREGDLVYDYYSQEPVVIGGPAGSPGWFTVTRPDGKRSTAGLLDGSRVCTLAAARQYGHSMKRVPVDLVEERYQCECGWSGYLRTCPKCGADAEPVVRVVRVEDERSETFSRDDLDGILTAEVVPLFEARARFGIDEPRGYELRRYFGPEDEPGSVESTLYGRDARQRAVEVAVEHARKF